MGIYVNPGNASFREALNSMIYVDKSRLLSYTNRVMKTKQKHICVSRPRRFGKSMAADMLVAYYSKGCDSRELFAGLAVEKEESFNLHLNQHHVIRLDMQQFLFQKTHLDIFIDKMQEAVIGELREAYGDCFQVDEYGLPGVLRQLYARKGITFIFVIDEWDCVFRVARERKDIQKIYLDYLRGLFKEAQYVELAYMTGILPIKKYGTQSAMTDFREYSMISPKRLAEYVGFTEAEVNDLCRNYGMDFDELKRWYDGYSFSRIKSIYNPNSVMESIKNEELGNYWTQTETYTSLQVYIDLNEDGLKEAIVQMLGGARIPVDVGTFQNDMVSIRKKDDILTLLVHLGYLAYNSAEKSVSIPNEEIRQEFVRAVSTSRHKEVANLIRNSDMLLEHTLSMEEEKVAAAIQEAHRAGTAPLFYNNEQALRSVIRFAYISCIDEFLRIEELASGRGYADVVYFPKRGSAMPVLLIELKWNKTEDGAISQIKTNHYPEALQDYGREILLVGINYDVKSQKHTCKIERLGKRI